MAIEEYNIDDAWKHENNSSPVFSDDLQNAYNKIESCPLETIGLPMKRQDKIDFELYKKSTETLEYLNEICMDHNVNLDVPDQPDEGPTIVFLLPD